jgi:hypothetical protein
MLGPPPPDRLPMAFLAPGAETVTGTPIPRDELLEGCVRPATGGKLRDERRERESNPRTGLCRPLPNHSAIAPRRRAFGKNSVFAGISSCPIHSYRCTGLCRPLPNHSATAPTSENHRTERGFDSTGGSEPDQNAATPVDVNLVPGLIPRRGAGAPAPYRGSALLHSAAGAGRACRRSRDSRDRNERRSFSRAWPIRAASSPARACRRRSECRSRV